MPRGPRADAPGVAHHVMLRGIERRRIFCDAEDHEAFLRRLDRLVPELGFRCFAWALMPNHVHLALQTGRVPLARLMARLGTSYARAFNHRHDRVGHLFQNRYRSRRVEDDYDLLGLVLYIHRNPLRADLVPGPEGLGHYPWCGHGALTGERPPRPFEAPAATLSLLAEDVREARTRLAQRIAAREEDEDREALLGGQLAELENTPSQDSSTPLAAPVGSTATLDDLIQEVCQAWGLTPEDLGPAVSGRAARSRGIPAARAELASRATRELALPSRTVARALGVSDATISRALARACGPH